MATISLCMMVKDEARFLAACLDSAREAVDQMVVIDTGSVDGTQDIARAAGAELHESPWRDDFGGMRNQTLDHATGDWVLILDGDELLDEGAAAAIRALDLSDGGPDAYAFDIVNYTTDAIRADQANTLQQVRLFRRVAGLRYAHTIHNELLHRDTGEAPVSVTTSITVHHFGYLPSIWRAKNKGDRLALMQRAVDEAPERKVCRYHLATHLKILERHAEALEHFMVVVDSTELSASEDCRLMSFLSASFCAGELGDHTQKLSLAERLLEHEPSLADAHMRRAEALLELGREAEVVDDLVVLLADPDRWAIKRSALSFGVPYRLGRALFILHRYAAAAPLFESLAARDFKEVTVWTHLAVCRASLGDAAGARAALVAAEALAPDNQEVADLRDRLDSADGEAATTTASFRAQVATMLERGEVAEAQATLQAVLDEDPANPAAHNDLAVLLHSQGLSDRALEHLLYASDSDPRDLKTLQNLLEVCHGTDHEAEALARVERTLSLTVAGGGHGPRPSDDTPPSARAEVALRVVVAGTGLDGIANLLTTHTVHDAVELPRDAATDTLPPFDIIHVAGPLDEWPGVDWAEVLTPERALIVDEGDLPAELAPGALRVDARYPPPALPAGPRVEPVYDARDLVPLAPPAPLRVYHQSPDGDPDHPDRRDLEQAAVDLRFAVEITDEFDASALARCHAVWRPRTPSLTLTAMALGQTVLMDTTPVEAVVWPHRPTLPATRESLASLSADRSLGKAFRQGRAARRWVLLHHAPSRIAAHLSALYAFVRRRG